MSAGSLEKCVDVLDEKLKIALLRSVYATINDRQEKCALEKTLCVCYTGQKDNETSLLKIKLKNTFDVKLCKEVTFAISLPIDSHTGRTNRAGKHTTRLSHVFVLHVQMSTDVCVQQRFLLCASRVSFKQRARLV